MSQGDFQAANPYASFGATIADAPASTRADFIRKTYSHLAMAIFAFAALEFCFFQTGFADFVGPMFMGNQLLMIGLLGSFMLVGWIAESWARNATSINKQYAGLVTYVVAESLFFVPILWYANHFALSMGGNEIGILPAAGIITLVMFGGLSAIAWISGADFSFLRAGLGIAMMGAIGLVVISWIFGFHLGILFTVAMIILACGYILYDTSNVIHHYHEGQHVAASLALFASVALLFWYVIRLLIALSGRD